MSRAELILYATPVGPLADALDRLYRHLRVAGPTTAQEYPPHCTLTGFFRRAGGESEAAIVEIGRAVVAAGPVPDGAVEIVGLMTTDGWAGLEIRSPWLRELTSLPWAGTSTSTSGDGTSVRRS